MAVSCNMGYIFLVHFVSYVGNKKNSIYAEQMYGPRTTKRRGLALQLRKQLKQEGVIAGGFVNFPAKLFVNYVGHVDAEGKKIYKFHSDLSRAEVN